MAAGLSSRADLAETLEKSGIEYYSIGSCREPGQVTQAVFDGFEAGRKI